jgi:hypothetical protein
MNYFPIWLFAVWILCDPACSKPVVRKVALSEYQIIEQNYIKKLNTTRIDAGLRGVEFSKELMSLAQQVSQLQAKSGSLDVPNIGTNKKFIFYSHRLLGRSEDGTLGKI